MEDHFVLHVDSLLRESTAEAAAEGRNLLAEKINKNNINGTINRPVDCRICHDEDEVYNMETPCSCCGTMKYAHRKCIQRWCDEKGDITCEICRRFLLFLLLREALPTIISGSGQYSLQIFMMQLLKSAALGLPLYIMLRAVTTFQCRQQLQQQEASEISTQGRT